MTEQKRPYNGILYLGAGGLRTLHELSALSEVLYLVEARQVLTEELRKAASNFDNVKFIESVVSAVSQESTYFDYNLPWVSGMKLPSELSEIYPGLRKVSQRDVKTLSIEQLISDCGLDSNNHNALIIDSPGMELELLEVLTPEHAHCFEEIIIYTAKEKFQEDVCRLDKLISSYALAGYEKVNAANLPIKTELPWQIKIALHLNRVKVTDDSQKNIIRKQKEELVKLQARIEYSENQNKMLTQQLDNLKTDYQERLNVAEKARKKFAQKCVEIKTELENAESSRKELYEASEKLRSEQKVLQERLQLVEQINGELVEQKDQLIAERNNALADRSAEQDRINEIKQQKQILVQQLQESEKAKKDLEEKIEEQIFRSQLIDKEMIKAEAQIDLIKDVLIREKAF